VRAAGTSDEILDLDLDIDRADEGRVLLLAHLSRERDPRLRARKIKEARTQLGYVRCEACGFDFERTYGERGRDYIECHHKNPLSQTGRTTTSLIDLALVCSNCHRMIHRSQPWLSLDELRSLLRAPDKNISTPTRQA
jgi:5-methylcytosine-specific restriction protein A